MRFFDVVQWSIIVAMVVVIFTSKYTPQILQSILSGWVNVLQTLTLQPGLKKAA